VARRRFLHALTAGAAVTTVGLLAAGCGDDLPAPDRSATERMFLETCAPGEPPLEEEVCRCAFERIVEDLSAAELERLDRNLRDEPDTIPSAITEAALDCAADPLTP
jgi:hypothetical protein